MRSKNYGSSPRRAPSERTSTMCARARALLPVRCSRAEGTGGDMKIRRLFTLISGAGLFIAVCAGGAADPMTKSQSFDHDPSWDAHNNRLVPAKLPTVVQDFGYSPTNVAGKGPGEM